MDEVFDACCLQVFHASRSTCYDEHSTAVQCLECRNCMFSIFVVAWTDNHDVGISLHSSFYTFFYGCETEVVDYFISGTSQEVARELSTSLTHSQVTDSKHECLRTLAWVFCLQAECFEFVGSTVLAQSSDRLFAFFVTTAAALATERSLTVSLFSEVRILVSTEEDFATLSYGIVTSLVACVHSFLYLTSLDSFHHTAFFFYLEEEVPCLLSDRNSQVFDEVWTSSWVNHLVEVTFFLQQQLLVASDAFREIIWSLVCLVVRRNSDWVHTCKGSTHRFCLSTEHVHVSIEQCEVECRSFGMSQHLAWAVASRIVFLHDVCPQHTGCTELRDFQEVVRADTEVELNLLGCIVSRYASFDQRVQVFVTPSKGITQFLCDVRTCIVQFDSVNADATVLRESSHHFYQFLGGSNVVAYVLTLAQHFAHRVVVDRTLQVSQVVTLLCEVFYEQVSQQYGCTLACREIQFYTFSTNIVQ